jgi:hypothetical protein
MTGSPMEFNIPQDAKMVFVEDQSSSELLGGAELSTEALLTKAPLNVFKLHSSSLTLDLLEENRDKHWIIGNFALAPPESIYYLTEQCKRYSVIEYDFKFCSWRTLSLHMHMTNSPCNCASTSHGRWIEKFYNKAKHLFWMSARQRDIFENFLPSLHSHPSQHVLSSVFDTETLDLLATMRNTFRVKEPKAAILGSGPWIKGIEQTEAWCRSREMKYVKLARKPYHEFLSDLAKYETFVFRPSDYDPCPRVVIEAKLLGLDLSLNHNVLHKDEEWFKGTPAEIDAYLRNNADILWQKVIESC